MNEQEVQAIHNYKMPQTTIGKQVLWYPSGRPSRQHAQVAYMLHCGGRTCTLQLSTGRRMDAVRHIEDPKLNLSSEQREQGAWDFTQDQKELIEFQKDVLARLRVLEGGEKVPQPKKEPSEKGKAAAERLKKYHALRKEAEALGITVEKGMSGEDIRRAMAAKSEPQPTV